MSTAGEVPTVKEEIAEVVAKLGEPAKLACQIIGRPLPDIKWYHYGKELQQSRKYKMSSDGRNHSITIVTDDQDDEGLYTCKATNDTGEIEISGNVLLEAAPHFHPSYPQKELYVVTVGASLRIHVVYIGRPVPAIRWFHEKKLLSDSDNISIENTEHYTHLVVRNIHRKNHVGKYRVQLSNSFGTIDKTFNVEIQGNDIQLCMYA